MAGRKNRVNAVPTAIPATSTRPMLLRAAAPGPVTSVSGECPQNVATLVLRTGRGRGAADDEDPVLCDQAYQCDQPHLRVDIQRRRPPVGEEGDVRVRHLEERHEER